MKYKIIGYLCLIQIYKILKRINSMTKENGGSETTIRKVANCRRRHWMGRRSMNNTIYNCLIIYKYLVKL